MIAESGRKGMLIKVNALPPYNRNDSKSNDKSKKKKKNKKKLFCSLSFLSSTIVLTIVVIKNYMQ